MKSIIWHHFSRVSDMSQNNHHQFKRWHCQYMINWSKTSIKKKKSLQGIWRAQRGTNPLYSLHFKDYNEARENNEEKSNTKTRWSRFSRAQILPQISFRFDELGEPIAQTPSKPGLSLHAHLYCLHGAESQIGDDFSRSGASEVNQRFVLSSILRSSDIWVVFLKELIEPKLASPLGTVTKQGWYPTPEEAPDALLF